VSFVGVDVVCDGHAAAVSECAGLRATGWCRLSGRFERIFSKRHTTTIWRLMKADAQRERT